MLRGKFIAIRAYIKTQTSQIYNLMMQLKLLEKQEQTNQTQNQPTERNNKD
jgi:hypothetical protein